MKSIALILALLISPVAVATTPAHVVPEPVTEAVTVAQRIVPASSPAAAPTLAAATSDQDKLICERIKEIGSNRHKRVCKTMAQREREREAARNAVDKGSRDR